MLKTPDRVSLFFVLTFIFGRALFILYLMELSFSELRKREVINVSDGRCLGKITDLRLSFPKGILVGITVPGRKTGFLSGLFDKSKIYIDESRIIKIGGDVILVDISCENGRKPIEPCAKPPINPCPPERPKGPHEQDIFSGVSGRIDIDDY